MEAINFRRSLCAAVAISFATYLDFAGAAATDAGTSSARQTFIDNCAACHGEDGEGLKDLGADLASSAFVKRQTDTELTDFLKMGRQPDHPDSTMKLLMPAFDYLTDDELAHVVLFMRSLP